MQSQLTKDIFTKFQNHVDNEQELREVKYKISIKSKVIKGLL